jgi:hypothetical protein
VKANQRGTLSRLCAGFVLCVAAGACGGEGLPGPIASARRSPPQSQSVLTVVLNRFRSDATGPLRFDPRPLRANADPFAVLPHSVDTDDTATSRFRARGAEQLGVKVTDILRDSRCLFTDGGAPPTGSIPSPPDSTRERVDACRAAGQFTAVILGVPRPVVGEEAVAYPGAWKLRAQQITTSSLHTWDLYLRPAGADGWDVVEAKEVFGIMS